MKIPVAIVTGAGRGIGRGIAEELAAAGWSVVVNYFGNAEAAAAAIESCRAKARSDAQRFVAIRADIASPAERERLIEEAWSLTGCVDLLVNNAGVAPRVRADILDASEESFEDLLRTNLQGPYFLTQAAARRMLVDIAHIAQSPDVDAIDAFDAIEDINGTGRRAPRRKSIIFITSVSAEMVSSTRGAYCVSKAGLSMAAKLWSARLAADGIQVFEVRPGIMATDMTAGVKEKYDALIADGLVPAMRWGTPGDVGRVVRSLVTGDWGYSTGTVLHVDGGMHIPKL